MGILVDLLAQPLNIETVVRAKNTIDSFSSMSIPFSYLYISSLTKKENNNIVSKLLQYVKNRRL